MSAYIGCVANHKEDIGIVRLGGDFSIHLWNTDALSFEAEYSEWNEQCRQGRRRVIGTIISQSAARLFAIVEKVP